MEYWRVLWQSRKVRIALVDAFFSSMTVLVTALLSPENAKLALTVVAIWQPVFVVVVGGIAYEDGQAKASGLHYSQMEAERESAEDDAPVGL